MQIIDDKHIIHEQLLAHTVFINTTCDIYAKTQLDTQSIIDSYSNYDLGDLFFIVFGKDIGVNGFRINLRLDLYVAITLTPFYISQTILTLFAWFKLTQMHVWGNA